MATVEPFPGDKLVRCLIECGVIGKESAEAVREVDLSFGADRITVLTLSVFPTPKQLASIGKVLEVNDGGD